MWEHYKQTVVFTQLFIVMACATAYFMMKMPVPFVAAAFVAMQVGALGGAWIGTKIRRNREKHGERLPLHKD